MSKPSTSTGTGGTWPTEDGMAGSCSWSAPTGESRLLPGQVPGLTTLALRPDGNELALGQTENERHILSVLSLNKAEPAATLELPSVIETVVWHPRGRRLAASSRDSRINLWEVGQPRPVVLEGCGNTAIGLQFGSSGDVLISNGWECVLRFWDPHTGQQLLNIPGMGSYYFSPINRTLLVEGLEGRRSVEFVHREYRTLMSDPQRARGELPDPRRESRRPLAGGGSGRWDRALGSGHGRSDRFTRRPGPDGDADL